MILDLRKLDRRSCMRLWGDGTELPSRINDDELTSDELNFRSACEAFFTENGTASKYNLDKQFALELYCRQLPVEGGFPIRQASDDSIWRRLAMAVVPDIVGIRWTQSAGGVYPQSRFWASPQRNWLKSLWWYVHLCWQDAESATREILESGSTDAIMHLVERPGPGGFRIVLCREIMRRVGAGEVSIELLKRLLKLNTARVRLLEPSLHAGGVSGYVDKLVHILKEN